MIEKGKELKIYVNGVEIGKVVSCTIDTNYDIDVLGAESWSAEVDFEPINFDETWIVAYIGRMYSEMFKN